MQKVTNIYIFQMKLFRAIQHTTCHTTLQTTTFHKTTTPHQTLNQAENDCC